MDVERLAIDSDLDMKGSLESRDVKAGARVFELWKDYGLLILKGAEDVSELHIGMLSPNVVILFMIDRIAIG